MKKMFTLIVALLTISGVFAQHDNRAFGNSDIRYEQQNSRPDQAIDMHRRNSRNEVDNRMTDRERREEYNRINRDYQSSIDAYRNNRRMNDYERRREMDRLQKERSARLKNLGAGVLIGGVIGVLIGSHMQ